MIYLAYIFPLLISMQVHGLELAPTPVTDYFALSQWRERRVLEIPEGEVFYLTEDTDLVIDELVLNGTLVSQGFHLRIDTQLLRFGAQGSLLAFDQPAATGPQGPAVSSGRLSRAVGGAGGVGPDGRKGGSGQDGEQNPSAIVIHAVRTIGHPVISVKGQDGGQGGQGGQGGRGGQGGKGRDASANCLGRRRHGGPGGPGGQGGPGGPGGDGGRGGREVPLIYLSLHSMDQQTMDFSRISGGEGLPGRYGSPGDPGLPGRGGEGGEPHRVSCGWGTYTVGADRGARGPDGPPQNKDLGAGQMGQEAPSLDISNPYLTALRLTSSPAVLPIDNFEELRSQIAQKWFYFHWARSFTFLFYESLREVQTNNQNAIDGDAASEILSVLLNGVHRDRLAALVSLWNHHFILELENFSYPDKTGLRANALSAARLIVEFLRELEKDTSDISVREKLIHSLERIQSRVDYQLSSNLESALIGCRDYIHQMQNFYDDFTAISNYYSIPVCMGEPDFALPENIDKEIKLFAESQHNLPAPWLGYTYQISLNNEKKDSRYVVKSWLERFLLNQAFARQFSVSEEEEIFSGNQNFVNRLPDSGWQVSAQGMLVGYPSLSKGLNTGAISAHLMALSQALRAVEAP
jgi:hypothetical protein